MGDQKKKSGESAKPDTGEESRKIRSNVKWNDEQMQTNFANVVNIQGTKEQIELFFGINRTWNVEANETVKVDLTNRLILTPYAAKRMSMILIGVLREYEARHGALVVED